MKALQKTQALSMLKCFVIVNEAFSKLGIVSRFSPLILSNLLHVKKV
jgi:hypothetical protein